MEVTIRIVGQKLHVPTSFKNYISGSQEFVRFRFMLDDDWDGLLAFAQFQQNGVAYNQYLDSENCAYLPAEIQPGTFNMLLYGTGGNTIATTNYLTFTVTDNILISDAQSTEITQSLYTQLVTMVQSYTSSTDRLEAQIALKANESDLNEEITRATSAENSLSTAINGKVSQTDFSTLEGRVHTLETNPVSDEAVASAVDTKVEALLSSGAIANMTIQDGSITRSKVNSAFEATLAKADSAMQPSVYDPDGKGSLNPPVDPYSYADTQDAAAKTAIMSTESVSVTDTSVSNTTTTYSGLVAALSGVLNRSELYAASLLSGYSPFSVTIVDELPTTGEERTFYLVPNSGGDGYDKWWYITDENDNEVWDNFGSSSTEVVSALPQTGNESVDYILAANGEYSLHLFSLTSPAA